MNELMIPETADVPSYALNPDLAKQANMDAAAGISTGALPRIKMSGKTFALVDGNGDEVPVLANAMHIAEDGNAYLRCIVLAAKAPLVKSFYLKKFDPNATEYEAPDCFSNDGVNPDPSIAAPQSSSCAACPRNAFGSGTDQNGIATAGKACSDNKILAVYLPHVKAVYKLKVAPASLKNFGLFVKNLSNRGIPLGNVITLLGFDQTLTYPSMTFHFGGWVPEQSLQALMTLAEAEETLDIVNETITVAAPSVSPVAEPAAQTQGTQQVTPPPADDLGLGVEPPAQTQQTTQQPADDLGLGVEPPAQTQQATPPPADDDLAKSLGL